MTSFCLLIGPDGSGADSPFSPLGPCGPGSPLSPAPVPLKCKVIYKSRSEQEDLIPKETSTEIQV